MERAVEPSASLPFPECAVCCVPFGDITTTTSTTTSSTSSTITSTSTTAAAAALDVGGSSDTDNASAVPLVLPRCGHTLCHCCITALAVHWPAAALPPPTAAVTSGPFITAAAAADSSSTRRSAANEGCCDCGGRGSGSGVSGRRHRGEEASVTVKCPECGITSRAYWGGNSSSSSSNNILPASAFPRNFELLRFIEALHDWQQQWRQQQQQQQRQPQPQQQLMLRRQPHQPQQPQLLWQQPPLVQERPAHIHKQETQPSAAIVAEPATAADSTPAAAADAAPAVASNRGPAAAAPGAPAGAVGEALESKSYTAIGKQQRRQQQQKNEQQEQEQHHKQQQWQQQQQQQQESERKQLGEEKRHTVRERTDKQERSGREDVVRYEKPEEERDMEEERAMEEEREREEERAMEEEDASQVVAPALEAQLRCHHSVISAAVVVALPVVVRDGTAPLSPPRPSPRVCHVVATASFDKTIKLWRVDASESSEPSSAPVLLPCTVRPASAAASSSSWWPSSSSFCTADAFAASETLSSSPLLPAFDAQAQAMRHAHRVTALALVVGDPLAEAEGREERVESMLLRRIPAAATGAAALSAKAEGPVLISADNGGFYAAWRLVAVECSPAAAAGSSRTVSSQGSWPAEAGAAVAAAAATGGVGKVRGWVQELCVEVEVEMVARWEEEHDWRYSGVHALAAAPDGTVYSGSGDRTVKAWRPSPMSSSSSLPWSTPSSVSRCSIMRGHTAPVCAVAVPPSLVNSNSYSGFAGSDGGGSRSGSNGEGAGGGGACTLCDVVCSGSWDGTVRLWWREDHSPLAVLHLYHAIRHAVPATTAPAAFAAAAAVSATPTAVVAAAVVAGASQDQQQHQETGRVLPLALRAMTALLCPPCPWEHLRMRGAKERFGGHETAGPGAGAVATGTAGGSSLNVRAGAASAAAGAAVAAYGAAGAADGAAANVELVAANAAAGPSLWICAEGQLLVCGAEDGSLMIVSTGDVCGNVRDHVDSGSCGSSSRSSSSRVGGSWLGCTMAHVGSAVASLAVTGGEWRTSETATFFAFRLVSGACDGSLKVWSVRVHYSAQLIGYRKHRGSGVQEGAGSGGSAAAAAAASLLKVGQKAPGTASMLPEQEGKLLLRPLRRVEWVQIAAFASAHRGPVTTLAAYPLPHQQFWAQQQQTQLWQHYQEQAKQQQQQQQQPRQLVLKAKMASRSQVSGREMTQFFLVSGGGEGLLQLWKGTHELEAKRHC